MSKNLVIVESPAKAKTIEKFLGKDFIVKSCNGHVRDLAPKKLSIDVDNNFEPQYEVLKEKQKVITDLKKDVKQAEVIWLATDEDREGEAISWHLSELLNIPENKRKRIVFHEITKNAILEAIENPREINTHLVNAQQARRVLDRLVGFKISPVLWQKVKPALSAGRVQSVAVRLIVEREREILGFEPKTYFKVTAEFLVEQKSVLKAELNTRFDTEKEAMGFLESSINSEYSIANIDKKDSKRSPAPPFTTSTLQQEASRKLGYSVAQTMSLAQKLYESGHITYMRTDSTRLSNLAIAAAKETVINVFGEEYAKTRNFNTKSKSAQEAHEAIRPTNLAISELGMDTDTKENRLYELIWKRTIASQMSNALIEKTNIKIDISNNDKFYTASGEVIKFDGFLKLYLESTDDENGENDSGLLPPVKIGQKLNANLISATQRFTRPPARYSEAALVKKLEELGIGRPSTYAPTISTIQKREYVTKEYKEGFKRSYKILKLEKSGIKKETNTENTGVEKGKLCPSSIGMIVNDFLVEHFQDIVNYNFTADIEDEFDDIAAGSKDWQKMIDIFYKDFEPTVDNTLKNANKTKGERELGIDPETGEKVFAKFGKYGPFVQLGQGGEDQPKPKFAKLKKGQLIESITLKEALELLELPRHLGNFEGKEVIVNIGRFGPYVGFNSGFYAIPKTEDPYVIDLDKAIEIIRNKQENDKKKTIGIFEHDGNEMKILRGRYGPYISYMKKSYRIPKEQNPEEVDLTKALEIIGNSSKKSTTTKKKKVTSAKKKK